MARYAVLAGRTLADLVRNVFVVTLMLGVGFAVGFRLQTDVPKLLLGMAVLLLFGFSLSWIFALGRACRCRTPRPPRRPPFPILLPLVFASSAVRLDRRPCRTGSRRSPSTSR